MGYSSNPLTTTTNNNNNSVNSLCDMSLKCWCRWRWDHPSFLSKTSLYFIYAFGFFFSLSLFYVWVFSNPTLTPLSSSLGCQPDNEGSWSIGVFVGDSPFSLKPIESKNLWKDKSAAWPVANPVITCATVTDAGFPSNFVADPFLFVKGDSIYVFYETKNSITLQGDIGVSRSNDNGITWEHLGTALDENWHLSYPYVFEYNNQIYLMPESREKGELRLYRALEFPFQWNLEKINMKRPLVDSSLIHYDDRYWIFGSNVGGFGTKIGQLEIWCSSSPFGPWLPHGKNPIYKSDRILGARNGGRPFVYNGSLYRIGQDSSVTYGKQLRTFKVEVLTKSEYKEVEVPLGIEVFKKGRNAWNGVRYHHLDVQKLNSSNQWVGVMDGDRILSGDYFCWSILGYAAFAIVVLLILLMGVLLGAVKCNLPLSWYPHGSGKRSDMCLEGEPLRCSGKRSDMFFDWQRPHLNKLRRFFTCLNRTVSFFRGWMMLNRCAGGLILASIVVIAMALTCIGVRYVSGGNGAEEAYPLKGHYSQFTLLTMTYDARLWNLKMFVEHYSRCSSVQEIVVVWNKGEPPKLDELDSPIPIRIRVEDQNSLNNRFKVDPLIRTRGVLELDDDIMMSCDALERGFKVWRENPDRIVGFYPRLIQGSPLTYRNEKFARSRMGYNMILTGAAFIDSRMAFERYWSEEAKAGRDFVDKNFNCEDVLLNFLYANASSSMTVEYVKPGWVFDMSKFSGVAISKNTKVHYQIRSQCLVKFSELYGSITDRKWKFKMRKDGWDA